MLPMNPEWALVIIGVLGIAGTFCLQIWFAARSMTVFEQKLANVVDALATERNERKAEDRDIRDGFSREQDQQWSKITNHGERISRVEGRLNGGNGKAHGAGQNH